MYKRSFVNPIDAIYRDKPYKSPCVFGNKLQPGFLYTVIIIIIIIFCTNGYR